MDRSRPDEDAIKNVSEGYFTVEMVGPGIIHIEETEDETEWCVGDIFQLPTWYMVG